MIKLFSTIIIALLSSTSALYANSELKLGIFPYLPIHKLFKVYTPVAEDFAKLTGVPFVVKTKASFSQFESALQNEEYDIAFIQPFDYVMAHDQHHYLPLASRESNLSSIFVVKKDSNYNALSDLKGKIIANPPLSAAVTKLGKRHIKKAGFSPDYDFSYLYKNNHFSCLQAVLINNADACNTSEISLRHYEAEQLSDRFRIIVETEAVPHVLFVAHERVPEKMRNQIKRLILNWQNTPEGRDTVKTLKVFRFKAVTNKDYDILREIPD